MFSRRTAWPAAPNPLSIAVEAARKAGELLDLTESNPTRCGLHYDENKILKAYLDPANLVYSPAPRGLGAAREAVAGYYAAHGVTVSPANIILTTSTSEAYSFLFRLLCDAGEEALAPAPSYPLFGFLADLDDLRLKTYELIYDHGWQMDFHSLRAARSQRSRAVMLVHPNNPTGSFIKKLESEQLNQLCEEHNLALIADEVFLDYASGDAAKPFSFAGNGGALTFTLSGLSKISALPQMKLAWLVASGPEALVRPALERLEIIADTFLSLSAPAQHALPALLELRHPMIAQLRSRIAENLATLDAALERQSLCSRLKMEGGWYAVLRVPVTGSDGDLSRTLVERERVLLHPGHFYDFAAEGHLVASLITPREVFAEGIGRALEFIAR